MSTASAPLHILELSCHPDSRGGAVKAISAELRKAGPGLLQVTFCVEGRIAQVRLPAPAARKDRLWEHTCFEAFVARRGAHDYHELNFAPSGDWAAFAFHGYRAGQPLQDELLDPAIAVRTNGSGRLELDALVRLQRLSPGPSAGARLLALSAVIEEEAGHLSYWALRHPPGKPDFHHPEAFCLALDEAWH